MPGGEQRYYPFGESRIEAAALPTDRLFQSQRDVGLGLLHFGARFYLNKLGQFISADTLVPSFANPQSLNRYAFVENNPLNYIDPTGHTKMCGKTCEEELDKGWKPPVGESGGGRMEPAEAAFLGIPEPPPATIWTKLPVENPTDIQWYGNTEFAALYGDDHNYDGFAQGLHPGIDLIAPAGTPVYAGTFGKVKCINTPGICGAYGPGRIDISRHGRTLIYGHLGNIQSGRWSISYSRYPTRLH